MTIIIHPLYRKRPIPENQMFCLVTARYHSGSKHFYWDKEGSSEFLINKGKIYCAQIGKFPGTNESIINEQYLTNFLSEKELIEHWKEEESKKINPHQLKDVVTPLSIREYLR